MSTGHSGAGSSEAARLLRGGKTIWWWAVAGALAIALALRVGLVLATPHLPLVNDPADYQRLAVSIAHGHGYGRSAVAPAGGPSAFRPPLYPYLLGWFYWLVGVHRGAARIVQAVIGTGTVALVGALAHRFWGRAAALAALAIAALYPPLWLAGGQMLSESVALPLELGAVLAALASGRSARRWAWLLAAGVMTGMGILDRPDSAVLLAPVVLLARPLLPFSWRRWAAGSALVVVAAGLVLVPWLVRDARVMGHFVPLTTQAGLVASGTYNDTAAHDRLHPAAWRPTNFVPEYVPLIRGDEYHLERALRTAAVDYARAHPGYVARVVYWNLRRLFETTGPSQTRASWQANGYSPGWADLAFTGFWVVAALAVIGAATGAGRAPPAVWLVPVLLVVVTVPLLGESRLRLGIDPFLALLAGPGLLAVAAAGRAALVRWAGPHASTVPSGPAGGAGPP
ncbi:MAG TPA: glycosyltransferase family 39 protein [Acidimicrobiales bacterium]|nr:glycosyltransferase family 39 protein [Acidimicrobiales bacterium]